MAERKTEVSCPVGHADCHIIEAISDLRLRTSELESQVKTDALTGLINFRGFNECLGQEMERTRRREEPTSLLMVDIDHFKQVNDVHGHDIGNQALIHIAGLLCQTLRKLDIPCRFGGEEFALILPSTRLTLAIMIAERIRTLIEKTPLIIDRLKIPMTISLGVDCFLPMSTVAAEEFVKNADNYLYQAKHSGRNCTCFPPIDSIEEKAAVTTKERQDLFAAFGRKDP